MVIFKCGLFGLQSFSAIDSGVDMAVLEIDAMKASDLDEIMGIERESFSMPWSRWMFERELEGSERSHFLVARNASDPVQRDSQSTKIAGYVGFWMVMGEAHIVTIAVRRNYRRKGIGTMLLASALILAWSLGADRATLEVRVTNIPAQNLYRKFGFEIISIRKGFYTDTGEDAYVMWMCNLGDKIGEIRALVQKARDPMKTS